MDAAERPIPWRRRNDLVARPQGTSWVLKDPVAQRYFQLGNEAFFVWNCLTGGVSPASICRKFSERFAPRDLTVEELRRFLGQLVSQGLVWGDVAGIGESTERRRLAGARTRQWGAMTNILAIRLRGIDPDRWLNPLARAWGWVFSPISVLLGMLLLLSAIGLWLVRFDEFAHRLPEEAAQWSIADLTSFALVLAVLKVLHELGHAIACKRCGGEVRELGVLFLVFTPCLYCNVSDAWLLPSKWQRMAISAAGMWVELMIAAACVWLWWGSAPGWFHSTCLQVVFISGVSTLLFNLNPLLRYDGYFLLTDLCGVPNLQQRSFQELSRRVFRAVGFASDPRPLDLSRRQSRWLSVYAAAALLYRVTMIFAILWVLDRWLEPQGLRLLAQGIAGLTLMTLAFAPIAMVRQSFNDPSARQRWQIVSPIRTILAAVILVLLAVWPLPSRVRAPAILMPADARGIFVTMEGRLVEIVPPGTALQAGDLIARLENPSLQKELVRLEGEVRYARQVAMGLQRRQIVDPRARLQLPAAQKQLRDVEEQWQQRRADAERLTIRAAQAGTLWAAAARPAVAPREQLRTWSGSPFDDHNRYCWLTAGTQLGWIGDPQLVEAHAYVPQADVSRLEQGQTVSIVPEGNLDQQFGGNVAEVSSARLQTVSPDLAVRLRLPEVGDATGGRLVGTWYQLRIPVSANEAAPLALSSAEVAIHVPPEAFFERVLRWGRETFSATR